LSGNKNSPNQQNEISDQNNVDQLRKQSQWLFVTNWI
jgi:hypothetical protein